MKFGFTLSVAFTTLLLTNAAQANAQETWNTLPGEFAMRTLKGFYVTAINGGDRNTNPVVVTASTSAGPWEKFRIAVMDPPPPNARLHLRRLHHLPH
jgi:hypothetical protein